MNYISLDDNLSALAAIRQLGDQVDFLQFKGDFTQAMDAYNFLVKNDVDLLFLDLELPTINGLELIDKLESPPLIIIVSAKKKYALQAFEKHVVDYLVKPVTLSRFLSAVNFAYKIFESHLPKNEVTNTLFVKTNRKWNKLDLREVKYFQAMGDYVRIFTHGKNYMVYKTMKVLMKNLPKGKFVRVHRSYIVNISHIDNIGDNMIVINKEVIPISDRYKNAFMEHLNLL